jgi:LemA protein
MNKKGCGTTVIIGLLVVVAVVAIGFFSFTGTYNSLQAQDENVNARWKQVENQLVRRAELIPNLIKTTKGFTKQELAVVGEVAQARSILYGAINKGNVQEINKANGQMGGAMSRLIAIAENYPQIKSDTLFIRLMDELAGTENRLSVARKDYNDSVETLNRSLRTFPTNIISGFTGVNKREYFEMDQSQKQNPVVDFNK